MYVLRKFRAAASAEAYPLVTETTSETESATAATVSAKRILRTGKLERASL